MQNKIVLTNCRLIDANHPTPSAVCNVVITENLITDITAEGCNDKNMQTLDLKGYYLLPGLIDNHVHLTATQFNLADTHVPDDYIAIQSRNYLQEMLMRGFTSVRDAGGAGYGLQLATEKGLISGPRIFLSGKALSQTGGHGDFYFRNYPFNPCFCHQGGSSISVIADGVSAVRKVAREQIRQGASQIKIMASGGVTSPSDNIQNLQFSEDEIRAVVEEARNANLYVMAHAYTPAAIARCVKNGVRTIEHGNLIDLPTARLMHEHNAYLVPTMVTYHAAATIGQQEGLPVESMQKLLEVLESAHNAVKIAHSAHVKVGFGTDLLGPKAHKMQAQEFLIRSKGSETPYQILCSATHVNAEILQHKDKLGILKKNAFADLIAINANPLDDITLLSTGQGDHLALIIKDGKIYKNTISPSLPQCH